jgi:nucleoid-associated protein YgaU
VNAQTITVVSGNLFQIAAAYFGDATQWIRIAEMNRLSDPFLTGVTSLVIPATIPSAGAIIVGQ